MRDVLLDHITPGLQQADGNVEATSVASAYSIKTGGAEPEPTAGGDGLALIGETVSQLRSAFDTGCTRSIAWRRAQLDGLLAFINNHEEEIVAALQADVGKPPTEAWLAEIRAPTGHLKHLRKNLKKLLRPESVPTVTAAFPGKSSVVREPLGVVLLIAPWNFPLELCVTPLAGALAAGNCVLVKPSEIAPQTSALLARRLPQYLDKDCVKVIEGGVPETTEILRQRFDHIFYTGNGQVGRIVLAAAAKNLTPVTLELGGKSPVIIDESADLRTTARRLVWGKFLNGGQVCVSPDYALVHENVYERFIALLKTTIVEFFGEEPQKSPDYPRIVNARHHRRLTRLLSSGGEVVFGGEVDESDRYIAPTLLTDVPPEAEIMQEEIFGPLLPLLRIHDVEEAIRFINQRPKPLALYLFSEKDRVAERVIAGTSSGGVAVNHVVIQIAGAHLPFGGVGESGMGKYHGRFSIDTFSNLKAVVKKPTFLDATFVYPPFTDRKRAWLRLLV